MGKTVAIVAEKWTTRIRMSCIFLQYSQSPYPHKLAKIFVYILRSIEQSKLELTFLIFSIEFMKVTIISSSVAG